MPKLSFKPQSLLGRISDLCMVPIMTIMQGTLVDSPQRTHRWNNHHLQLSSVAHLDGTLMVRVGGKPHMIHRLAWWDLRFHLPRFGGWRDYVVIAPDSEQVGWHVGWLSKDLAGLSRVRIKGKVRLLSGPSDVQFFALNEQGEQIAVHYVGKGTIGCTCSYSKLLLL